MLNIKEIKGIYKERQTKTFQEWVNLKNQFIEESLFGLVEEECDPWIFHIVYFKIVNISDRNVYYEILKEYK